MVTGSRPAPATVTTRLYGWSVAANGTCDRAAGTGTMTASPPATTRRPTAAPCRSAPTPTETATACPTTGTGTAMATAFPTATTQRPMAGAAPAATGTATACPTATTSGRAIPTATDAPGRARGRFSISICCD